MTCLAATRKYIAEVEQKLKPAKTRLDPGATSVKMNSVMLKSTITSRHTGVVVVVSDAVGAC